MAQIGDTLTTREAVRRAALADIVDRAEIASQTITEEIAADAAGLVGTEFVSLGTLRDIVTAHLAVDLPPTADKYAEVSTPARIMVAALCPECGLPANIAVNLAAQLTVDDDGAELAVKAKTKAMVHVCGQLSLPESEPVADGQVSVEDAIDTLRLHILRAVADVSDTHANEIDPGPPSTLSVIAEYLERTTESDISDLEDALYGYAEQGLVEVVRVKKEPPTYVLTEAGIAAVAAADEAQGDADAVEDEPSDDEAA
jgi:hypothetical protein